MKYLAKDQVAAINACGKYLLVSVLRPARGGDSTIGGVSSRFANLYIPHPEGPTRLEDLTKREADAEILELVPPAFMDCPVRVKPRGETRWCMAGGNYVSTSDSRFSKLYGAPLSVHDRIEA